jgi:tRNA 2-thiouridine synthesizing protein C
MKYLLIQNTSPYKNYTSQDGLELTLGLANFDCQISLVFMHDGVLHLLQNQDPENILRKNLEKTYKSLELHDINNIYVDQYSLQCRNIKIDELVQKITLINNKDLANLISQHDKVINI